MGVAGSHPGGRRGYEAPIWRNSSHPGRGYEPPILVGGGGMRLPSGVGRVESNERAQAQPPADTSPINFTPIKPTSCLTTLLCSTCLN